MSRDGSAVVRIAADSYATLCYLSTQTGHSIAAVANAAIEYAAERVVFLDADDMTPDAFGRTTPKKPVDDDWEDEEW